MITLAHRPTACPPAAGGAASRTPPPGRGPARRPCRCRARRARGCRRARGRAGAARRRQAAPVVVDLDLDAVRRVAHGTIASRRAGVPQRVGQALLRDAVRRQVDARAATAHARPRPRAVRRRPPALAPAPPAGRARRGPAAARARPTRRPRAAPRRAGASRPAPRRAVASTAARSAASRAWSGPSRRRTAWVWMVTTLIEWDTMSCSSRAIRVRSSARAGCGLAARARARAVPRGPRPPRCARPAAAACPDGPRPDEEDRAAARSLGSRPSGMTRGHEGTTITSAGPRSAWRLGLVAHREADEHQREQQGELPCGSMRLTAHDEYGDRQREGTAPGQRGHGRTTEDHCERRPGVGRREQRLGHRQDHEGAGKDDIDHRRPHPPADEVGDQRGPAPVGQGLVHVSTVGQLADRLIRRTTEMSRRLVDWPSAQPGPHRGRGRPDRASWSTSSRSARTSGPSPTPSRPRWRLRPPRR